MDNPTHAFAGWLLADATGAWIERRTGTPVDRRTRRTLVALGVIGAELPDADLLYSGPVAGLGPLGYLLHHRGHTHTVVFAVAAALLMWWMANAWRQRTAPDARAHDSAKLPMLVLAMAATLSHVLLDFSNSYGVHPFWPVDNRWYYGDSVFIVEPWLWVVAIPPLLFGPRRVWSRVLLSLLLLAIVVAAWRLGALTPTLALVITCAAVVWLAVQRWIGGPRRIVAGIGAWCVVEVLFAVSSAQAKRTIRQALPLNERAADIVATPGPGTPFCFDAFVVSVAAGNYNVRTATIAPWPSLRVTSAHQQPACRSGGGSARLRGLDGVESIGLPNTAAVTWGQQWTVSLADARALAETHCEFAYALRFMRVPVWRREPNGVIRLSDARFGVGSGGFSNLAITDAPCPLSPRAWIPPWTAPRSDLLN